MTLSRRASLFITTILICFFVAGCGETFRPVVIPIAQPGPDPQGAKTVIVVSQAQTGGGLTTHIDLAGDVNLGEARVGPNPVHAATFLSGSRVAIANNTGDSLSTYGTPTPSSQAVSTASLPAGDRFLSRTILRPAIFSSP